MQFTADQIFENSILEALEDTEKQKSLSHKEKKKIKMVIFKKILIILLSRD